MVLSHPHAPCHPDQFAVVARFIPPIPKEPAMAASARVTPTEPQDLRLTPAEATDLLPRAETVHVLIGTIRARWEHCDLAAAIQAGRDHRLTLAARSAGFGLSFVRDSGESVLVQTDDAKVRGWTERRSTEASE